MQPKTGDSDDSRMYKRQKHKEKHLYLVLDDRDKGFTIRKIDADDSPDDDLILSSDSEPPVLRLLSPNPIHRMAFAAMGSSYIIASSKKHPATLVYDTDTAGLTTGPPLPDALQGPYYIFLPAGDDTLYAFAYYVQDPQAAVQVLSCSSTADAEDVDLLHSSVPTMDWSWRSTAPLPFTDNERICSYPLHPDGRTIFFSACNNNMYACADQPFRTLSFDTGRSEWTCHGEWALPFMARGHFDNHLDAWVGLHEDGYIGACQAASPTPTSTLQMQQLGWKMACDKLWSKERLVEQPTLTSMGGARFCLVACVLSEGKKSGYSDPCMLNVTTFRLRYSHKGELQIFERATKSCQMYKKRWSFSPVAFWM